MPVKIYKESFIVLIIRMLVLCFFFLFRELYESVQFISLFVSAYLLCEIIFVNRLNYTSPNLVFNTSWLLIILFSMFDYSSYYRALNISTISIISISLIIFNIFCSINLGYINKKSDDIKYNNSNLKAIKLVFIFFVLLNIAIAGYIPLIKLFITGDSGYLDFGMPGLYGLFLAFSNALGILCFYIYMKTNNKRHLYFYLFIILIFILFMTRQNIFSLAIESFFIYTILKGRIQVVKAMIIVAVAIVVFGFMGSLRSGDITELAGVHQKWQWLPTSFTWIYSYFYFNILNLDNMINYSGAPFYDNSSLSGLVPSFLRGESSQDYISTLEVLNFNIASYMYPIYADMGRYWLYSFTAIVAFMTKIYFDRLSKNINFKTLSACSVLYFCALMSFFVNFWTFLPIIFQLVFIPILWGFIRIKERSP